MKRAWPRKAAFIKGVVQDFFMNSPPSYDFRTTPTAFTAGLISVSAMEGNGGLVPHFSHE